MPLPLLTLFLLLCGSAALADAQSQPEPRIPLGATWSMTMEQAHNLAELERAPDGTLTASYTIRASSQTELVARWQGRAVSLFFARGFGLYAIGLEMVPQAQQHTASAADPELQDVEQCAPIRLAVIRKYGIPRGIAESWNAAELAPLPATSTDATTRATTGAVHWPYAANWLIWEGAVTRLALGEQFVWYVSRAGRAHREQARQAVAKEGQAVGEREAERHARRRQEVDLARQGVPLRAREWESLF